MTVPKARKPPSGAFWQSSFQRLGETRFCGAIWDLSDPQRRFVVEFLLDGIAIECATADLYEPTLKHISDKGHGFSFEIDADVLAEASVAEARLANLGTPIGSPIFVHRQGAVKDRAGDIALVQWLGGLRFAGAIQPPQDDSSGRNQIVKAVIEGEMVAEARADRWRNNGLLGQDARALAAFDLYVPQRFADGCVHRVHFIDHTGQQLLGSPLVFFAFADGLADLVAKQGSIDSERLRGSMFDQLMPMSVPFSHYADWCEKLPKHAPSKDFDSQAGVVLVGDGDEEASLTSLEIQTRPKWVALALPYCDDAQSFECGALRDFLVHEAASSGFIIFAKAGITLTPDAIERFDKAFLTYPKASIAYCDIAIKDANNRIWPIAFSVFDRERLLEQGYCCALFAVRRDALAKAFKDKTLNLYRLFNTLAQDQASEDVLHLPGSLGTIASLLSGAAASRALIHSAVAHMRAHHMQAKVTPTDGYLFPALKVTRQVAAPSVTIIIPIRNRVDLLWECLESIKPAVKKNAADIIIVDNDSSDPETLAFLSGFETPKRRVLRVPGPFNFSKLNNLAAEVARSDYLCLLNNDVQALDAAWLNELLSRCVETDVAAVGALLVWPSGVVQHGGTVLGSNFGAAHAFNDRLSSDPGYADLLLTARECSAVTAACMVTRRADYLDVGGFDEVFFPINFNDVDYCLKLRARGKRVIFTPHAKLLHLESASRGDHKSAHRKALFERELRSLRTKWMEVLLHDPFYNPMLSLDAVPFSALAWPLRNMGPRWGAPPEPIETPSGI